jgi:coenzyme F420-reducing hydrogenase alpha subunit
MSENAVPKIEGHAAFYAHLKAGRVDKAQVIGLENDRFVEKLLVGRKYWEAPIITSRICGICPTIHNTTSVKAIEAACGITATPQTVLLRKLILAAQMVQSHSLHLYLLVAPDFVGASSSFELQKDHPELFQNAIELKRYSDRLIEVVGGRAVHPIADVPGGFKSYPTKDEIKEMIEKGKALLEIAENTLRLFASFEFPKVERDIIYSALHSKHEYDIYDGDIWTSVGDTFKADNYTHYVYEELKPYTRAKFGTLKGKEMMVGAIARLNLNWERLSTSTKKLMEELKINPPYNNPFQNTIAQAIENYFFVEQAVEILEHFAKNGLIEEPLKQPTNFGKGTAACEAPRGTLFHHYEIDKDGFIAKCDLITPTVQSLPAMELDIRLLEPYFQGKNEEERTDLIEMLLRAYDPCITCATH